MPQYFTLAEAERMLPEVERLLRDALFQKTEYQTAEEEFNRTTQRIRMAGGSRLFSRSEPAATPAPPHSRTPSSASNRWAC
jgi:hypothetical protein